MRIENILIENGFAKISGAKIFSTSIPGGVWHSYKKGNTKALVGLGTYGHPPTLLEPTPYPFDSASTIGWLEKMTDKQIIEYIENNQ
jgi:hypothetical protein